MRVESEEEEKERRRRRRRRRGICFMRVESEELPMISAHLQTR